MKTYTATEAIDIAEKVFLSPEWAACTKALAAYHKAWAACDKALAAYHKLFNGIHIPVECRAFNLPAADTHDRKSYAVQGAEFTLKRPWKITSGRGGAKFIETQDGEVFCQLVGKNREAKGMAILRDYDDCQDLLAALEDLIEDADAYSDGLSCVSCGGELGRDDNGNDTEVEHEDGCRFLKAKTVAAKARRQA